MSKIHKHEHIWQVKKIRYNCKICGKGKTLLDIVKEAIEPKSTISDVVRDKKGRIKKFVNEREMKSK